MLKVGKSILFRITLLSWIIIIVSLGAFALLIIPYEKDALIDDMETQSRIIASSIAQVTASSVVAKDFNSVIEHCLKVLKGNPSIRYIVVTRRDGFSLVLTEKGWTDLHLDGIWRPESPSKGIFAESPIVREKVFHCSYPVIYTGIEWGWIHIGLSTRKFSGDLRNIYRRTAFLFTLCIIGGLGISFIFGRELTRPLFLLDEMTQRVKSGDLSARAHIRSGDELERLASSFNRMTETLQESQAELIRLMENEKDLADAAKEAAAKEHLKAEELEITLNKLEETYKALQSTQNQLIQTGKMAAVGQLAAGVAHEINNPLTAVLLNSQALCEKMNSTELRNIESLKRFPQSLELIVDGARRCKTIVENLLSFSRQSKEKERTFLDMNEILEMTKNLLEHQIRIGRVELKTQFDRTLSRIPGNANQLQQVFMNIILNAIQFMPDGGEIELTTRPGRDGKSVEALIRDSGPGIPEENLDLIFEPFFTTTGSYSSKMGTGLGLTICYNIIKEHDGAIEIQSSPGKGATFIVRLPNS
jgi:signal transduction histidine kinase